jgi:ketosteroid isomerase-like protein
MASNVAVATRFLDILSGPNLSPLRELFCEDVRFEYPGLGAITGRGKTVLLLKKIMSRFEALRFQAVDFVQDGEKLCVLWTNEGRFKAGAAFRNEGVTVLHIRDGAISYVSDYFKHDRAA